MGVGASKIDATIDATIEDLAMKGGRPSLADAALVLETSPRSLQRLLERNGHSFTDIVEACLAERAKALLKSPSQDIHAISEQLGYRDPSSFSRAFRRWTGQCPREFRREHTKRSRR